MQSQKNKHEQPRRSLKTERAHQHQSDVVIVLETADVELMQDSRRQHSEAKANEKRDAHEEHVFRSPRFFGQHDSGYTTGVEVTRKSGEVERPDWQGPRKTAKAAAPATD